MRTVLLLLMPVLVWAQFQLEVRKPALPVCSHGRTAERGFYASLDAESLHTYDQLELILHVYVQNGDSPLVARTTTKLVARENLTTIPFNAEGLTVTSVRVNNQVETFSYPADTLYVQRAVAQAETVNVEIEYTAQPNSDWMDTGFQTGWEHCYTFSEPFGARRWYPCWDQPSDKFDRVETFVHMPEDWTAAANGTRFIESPDGPGRVYEGYIHDKPISTYLVMFAAGKFSKHIFDEGTVTYRYYAWPKSDSAQAEYDWARTPEMVELFSELFGDYPFREYGMVMTDIFGGWGAMEHQTFTTYGFRLVDSTRFFEPIVAHELGHQWFGDHLSPVDFRNMWLNEGFATYCGVLWLEHLWGDSATKAELRGLANACRVEEIEYPPSYSVYNPPMERIFGVNVYYKGAWVLHMLREQILGDSVFFEVIRDYVETFGGGNVDTDDLIDVVNVHYSGEDVDWFFDQWVYGLGMPFVSVDLTPDPGERILNVHVQQLQSTPGYFRFPLVIEQGSVDAPEVDTIWVSAEQDFYGALELNHLEVRVAEDQIALFNDMTLDSPVPPIALPSGFQLGAAYPNPFNPNVTIPFSLDKSAIVKLKMFDITGRQVATLLDQKLDAGTHSIQYDAPGTLSAGVYLLRAQSGEKMQTQKLLLLK
jgi:aminopeptidase N